MNDVLFNQIPQCVREGVLFLNKKLPDWYLQFEEVEVYDRLDISSHFSCLLGILFDNYTTGRERLGVGYFDTVKLGFDAPIGDAGEFNELTIGWKIVISRLIDHQHQLVIQAEVPEAELALCS